jgi:hypothetical protein
MSLLEARKKSQIDAEYVDKQSQGEAEDAEPTAQVQIQKPPVEARSVAGLRMEGVAVFVVA